MPIDQLPLLAGRILSRLGLLNATEMDEMALTQKIAQEQEQRTKDRKVAQIKRAKKKGKKETLLEVSINATPEGTDNEPEEDSD